MYNETVAQPIDGSLFLLKSTSTSTLKRKFENVLTVGPFLILNKKYIIICDFRIWSTMNLAILRSFPFGIKKAGVGHWF